MMYVVSYHCVPTHTCLHRISLEGHTGEHRHGASRKGTAGLGTGTAHGVFSVTFNTACCLLETHVQERSGDDF